MTNDLVFERAGELIPRTGQKRSTFYDNQKRGLWTPGVQIGPNSTVWPRHESDALMAARLAGQSDEQIRALVKRLVEQRAELFADLNPLLGANARIGGRAAQQHHSA